MWNTSQAYEGEINVVIMSQYSIQKQAKECSSTSPYCHLYVVMLLIINFILTLPLHVCLLKGSAGCGAHLVGDGGQHSSQV